MQENCTKALEYPTFRSQLWSIPILRGMISRDSCLPHDTRRSDDEAQGYRRDPPNIQNNNKKKGNNQATRSRVRDLPEWLEEFTDILEDTEVAAHANTSCGSERSDEPAPRVWCGSPSKTKNKNRKRDGSRDADDRSRDLPEWLDEFTDNLEDTEVPAHAHISQDSDSERHPKLASRKHSIRTHIPKDQNCEVCKRTKITRPVCRRFSGEALLRAQKFGDLITADHRVINEECESRYNHQYVVVVQDLATQWIQSYPCKTKTSQETEKIFTRGIWQILWWSIMESLYFDTLIDLRRLVLLKERYAE